MAILMPRVMIATPTYDSRVGAAYVRSLLQTALELRDHDIASVWWPRCGDSLLPSCRNAIVAGFMASDCTHLLWVDSDISWEPGAVRRLLSHRLDFVAGRYRAKAPGPPRYDWIPLEGAQVDDHGVLEAEAIGSGFMLTSRRVYQQIAETFPSRRITGGRGLYRCSDDEARPGFDYFPLGLVGTGLYMAEDLTFCGMHRAAGGRIFVDTTISLGHHGRQIFAGDEPGR